MENKSKILLLKIIGLITSIIVYVPILGITLFVIGLSGIDDSCKFLDFKGISAISHTPCINRPDDFVFDIAIIGINLIFIIFILFQIIKIVKNKQ